MAERDANNLDYISVISTNTELELTASKGSDIINNVVQNESKSNSENRPLADNATVSYDIVERYILRPSDVAQITPDAIFHLLVEQ